MRIGLDARFFGPQQTGIGRYVERLVTHLAALDQPHEFVLFLRREAYDWWMPPNNKWTKVLADYQWYGVAEQRRMPGIFTAAKLDLLHVPHFNVPLLYRRPFVVTIHDLILDQFPTERATTLEPIVFAVKMAAYNAVVRHAINDSRRVITVSEHSRQGIIKKFKINPAKVTVTYEAVDPLPPPVAFEKIQARGITKPYLLHVGNSYPHKNLERLIEAVALVNKTDANYQLVLVGRRDYFSRRLEKYVTERNLTNVVFYGFASEEELAALYQHAKGYIFPSLAEGYGLPGLEAMQAGIPLAAARTSCLPEVFDTAAEYFDPYQPADIARSIDSLLHDTIMGQRLIAAGRRRLTDFSWQTMATQTLAVYEQSAPHVRTPNKHS